MRKMSTLRVRRLFAALQASKAPAGTGVTGGDAHDHEGGDGAQIDHAELANLNSTSYSHLTAAQKTDLTDGGATTLHTHTTSELGDATADSITMNDAGNIILNETNGTKIGTAAAQKLAFYNAVPVNQPDAVADATGAGDVVAQLNALLARIRELGLIAT